jgi:hypothetical protein
MVTVAVLADAPLKTTGLGATVQVDWAGAPAHVKVKLWLKPPVGASEMV